MGLLKGFDRINTSAIELLATNKCRFWWLISSAILVLVLLPTTISAQEPSIKAPTETMVGAVVDVHVEGEINPRDFFTIVSPDTEEGRYGTYQYASRSPVKLVAPPEPGEYEIRQLQALQPYATLWHQALKVIDVVATIDAPEQVNGGEEFQLSWTGPDNAQDFITIVPVDTPEGSYKGGYRYTKKGSPLKIIAPEVAGAYELRYLMGSSPYRTLGRTPLTVGGISASITAPVEVKAGSRFSFTWEGPDNPQDFLTIVPVDTPEKEYGNYTYTKQGSPASLLAPEDAGPHEVRYLTGQNYITVASAPIELLPLTASVSGPASVEAKSVAVVTWEGPDNPQDYIIILPAGADNSGSGHYAYTARGNELRIQTPDEPGEYEFRYLTGRKHNTLAAQAVTVTPRSVPGRIRVVDSTLNEGRAEGAAVVVVLDASGSMLQRIGDERRIDIAKKAVSELVEEQLPSDVRFSLRVFGHKEKDSCRTDVEIPLGPLDRSKAAATVASINAMNLAKTPIAATLSAVGDDLAEVPGPHLVILLTDGEETCDGDPAAVIQSLVDRGLDVRVNIVGFAIDELMLRETFQAWARIGHGQYFDARNAEELSSGLAQAIDVPFEVHNEAGELVTTGTVNGPQIELLPGKYTISTPLSGTTRQAEITGDELTVVSLQDN